VFGALFAQAVVDFRVTKQLIMEASQKSPDNGSSSS
jgi:hypothetical protein